MTLILCPILCQSDQYL